MANWKKYILWFAQEHVEFRTAVSVLPKIEPLFIGLSLSLSLRVPRF